MDSCICWYDIKKQGYTNEGSNSSNYPDDFSTFGYLYNDHIERTSTKITVLPEYSVPANFWINIDDSGRHVNAMRVKVSGCTKNMYLRYYYREAGNNTRQFIDLILRDFTLGSTGNYVFSIPESAAQNEGDPIMQIGFVIRGLTANTPLGTTLTIEMLPNEELKDFSGKNHDMQLYNFAWSGMSGIGGYNYDFKDWFNDGVHDIGVEITKNSTEMIWTSLGTRLRGDIGYQYFTDGRTNLDEINLYIENIPTGATLNYHISYGPAEGSLTLIYTKRLVSGVNTIPAIADIPVSDRILVRIEIRNNDKSDLSKNPLTIRQIPQYPNALVSDGGDDYGSSENFPLQDDFTIIAKRHRISNAGCLLSKRTDDSYGGAFLFEGQIQNEENGFVDSFGTRTQVNWAEDDIVYMTPTSYNGTPITKGADSDHNRLNLFMVWNNYFLSAALYKLLIFDRTLSDEEIQWVKHNLIEDVEDDYLVDAWFMSDYDNSDNTTGFTINGVKGTELTPKNFAFNGSSGFGKYSFNSPSIILNQGHCTVAKSGYKVKVTADADLAIGLLYPVSINIKKSNLPLYTPIRVKAFTDKGLSIRGNNLVDVILNLENKGEVGEFIITNDMAEGVLHFKTKGNTILASNEMFAWEFLPTPETEGSLVFDGVDDYLINDPYTLPLLDDYTIICRREIENDNTQYCVMSKSISLNSGAFVFETDHDIYSFGLNTGVPINKQESVSYQTKTSYNGTAIAHGTAVDEKQFIVGTVRPNDGRFLKGNIKYIALYNKSLTPLQIEREIKKLEEKWQSKLESRNNVSLIS